MKKLITKMAQLKKMAVIVAAIATASIAFNSCKSLGVYDKSVPKNQLATLMIMRGYTVTKFDGKVVEWKGPKWMPPNEGFMIQSNIKIPAGRHEIEIYFHKDAVKEGYRSQTFNEGRERQTWYQKGVAAVDEYKTITIDIEAGKNYTVDNMAIISTQGSTQLKPYLH